MRRRWICTIITALLIATLPAIVFAGPLVSYWQGYYVAASGDSEETGKVIEVDVFPAYEGQAMFIDFKVAPDDKEAPLGATAAAFGATRERFFFTFTDNRGNKGRGVFSRNNKKFSLKLQLTRSAAAGQDRSLYRDYQLVRKSHSPRSDRHPWSLGYRNKDLGK